MAGEKVMKGDARFTLDGKTVFHAIDCSMDFTRATRERNTKDTNGRELAKGIKSFSIGINSLAVYNSDGSTSHDFKSLYLAYHDDSEDKIAVEFLPDETDATFKLTGEAIITNMSGNFANEEDGTASLTLEGGEMTPVDLPVA